MAAQTPAKSIVDREWLKTATNDEVIEMTNRYCSHNYAPIPITIVEGDGAWVTDSEGKRYIDCVGSYSAMALGHRHPAIIAAIRDQLDTLTVTSRAVFTRELALFMKAICEYTGMDMACPMNAGAEAVETAIKLARKWAYTTKIAQPDKAEILVAENNFHGRTTTIVGFSSEVQYREGFGPFPEGFKIVPFGDIEELQKAITANTAAVLLEPIQAEAGILMPPDGYLTAVRRLCSATNTLLIWDEIQTGFCRTGKRFAWQHEDAKPDMICLGKALGGGVLPVSAVVGSRDVMSVFQPGDHGSTFGGNALSSAVAIAVMEQLTIQDLEENSRLMGNRLMGGFRSLGGIVHEVRGRGLLVGLEVEEGVDTKQLGQALLDQGILTKETRHRTFRFAPPLTVGKDLIDEMVERVSAALKSA